jgi:hypothetical protein
MLVILILDVVVSSRLKVSIWQIIGLTDVYRHLLWLAEYSCKIPSGA